MPRTSSGGTGGRLTTGFSPGVWPSTTCAQRNRTSSGRPAFVANQPGTSVRG